MSNREAYAPGPARGARIQKNEDRWTLVIVRQLHHAPEKVWQALTDPAQLHEWAPFDADRHLDRAGVTVKLTTVGTPVPHTTETRVTRADPPKWLEYSWGNQDMRWDFEPVDGGTRLTLWTNIDRRFIAMGAAGWHICFDVLDQFVNATPIGRIAGPEAMKFDGWQQLYAEYAREFGIDVAK
ncbi:MAG: SRPBCC domain-containing protein [Acidobacteriales bacterium]|nr:SRPBCC domain-containing protein [Terriglobales bacterium]